MEVNVGDVVLPGDIPIIPQHFNKVPKVSVKPIIGPGLRQHLDSVIVSKSGILCMKEPNTYWVDCHQKRYVPTRGESVIGIITNKSGDIFRVDIGSSEQASISYLAFEGATKKNRPPVQVGDAIFAKLVTANRDLEPELVCVDSIGKKGKLGALPEGGLIFTCSLNLCRKLLQRNSKLMTILGKELPHEIAIGMNGKVWVKAKSVNETIAIVNAILASENLTNEELIYMCDDIFNNLLSK